MKFSGMKISRAAGIAGIAVLVLLGVTYIQIRTAENYAEARMIRGLILWGGLLKTAIAAGAMAFLAFLLIRLSRKQDRFAGLFRALENRDYAGLAALPEPEDADAKAAWGSLVALGKTVKDLGILIAQYLELRETLSSENAEREAVIGHIGGIADAIMGQFYEIESSANQAADAMGDIGTCLHSMRDAAGGQSKSVEQAEERLSETVTRIVSLASRLGEISKNAESLGLTMAGGEAQIRELSGIIKNIARDVERITEITGNINRISEQTHILSMNAAIESAHASSAGAGFAVVAGEIKKLSESTRENARLIREELRNITEKTQKALRAGENSSRAFGSLSGEIKAFGENLTDITRSVLESAGGDIGTSVKESADNNRRISDGSLDIMAHRQSFETALGLIRDLTGKTRTEIREIHSGTKEILEKTALSQQKLFESLNRTQALNAFLHAGPKNQGEKSGRKAGDRKTGVKKNAAGNGPGKNTLDQRGVAVKQAPTIIT
jgi:methyl-accepting chemotaxis protein